MLALDPFESLHDKKIEDIKKYLSKFSFDELNQIGTVKYNNACEYSHMQLELGAELEPLEEQLLDPEVLRNSEKFEELKEQYIEKKEAYEHARIMCIKNHLESCCLFIKLNENLGRGDEHYSEEELNRFPARDWETVKKFQIEYEFVNYEQESGDDSGVKLKY